MAPRASPQLVVRKKMRKGTHSCFECRRRKIRCIFPPDNPNVCTECFARGSRCIDQEHASADAIVDHRKNLRERVSRLESLVDTLIDDKPDRGLSAPLKGLGEEFSVSPQASDGHPFATPDQQHDRGPSIHHLDTDVKTNSAGVVRRDTMPNPSDHKKQFPATSNGDNAVFEISCDSRGDSDYAKFIRNPAATAKLLETTRTLLSALPPSDQLEKSLDACEDWWQVWRLNCPGTVGINMGANDYAKYAFDKGHPASLASVLLCVGSTGDRDATLRSLALVERWVLSDDEYACSLEGLECALISGMLYNDRGQPRRAWLTLRRAYTFAQLMNLHRNHNVDPVRDSIWWYLFQLDRFTSLLLGLPYGSGASLYDHEIDKTWCAADEHGTWFKIKVSEIAGQIIDNAHGKQSYSVALDIDQELENIIKKMPKEWWDITPLVEDGQFTRAHERVAAQFGFHQARLYLHLAFMLKSAAQPRYSYSRDTCFTAARNMLGLYHSMRQKTVDSIYECKVLDFVAFHGTLVLVLGLMGYCDSKEAMRDPKQDESDNRLVQDLMSLLEMSTVNKGGNVETQSLSVLSTLMKIKNNECTHTEEQKLAVPYFGTITILPTKVKKSVEALPNTPPPSDSSQYSPPQQLEMNQFMGEFNPQANSINAHVHGQQQQQSHNHFIPHEGLYLSEMAQQHDAMQQQQRYADNAAMGNVFHPINVHNWVSNSAVHPAGMDIDSDWSWFLNDQHQLQPLS